MAFFLLFFFFNSFFLFYHRYLTASLNYDPFIHLLTPLLMQIIAYCKLKHCVLNFALPFDELADLKPPHISIDYVSHGEFDPSAPFNQLNDALRRYPLLPEYNLDVANPRLSDELSYLVVVRLKRGAFWVLWLVIQVDLQIGQLLEMLATETYDIFELVESIDRGLQGGQVGEGVEGELGQDRGMRDSERHMGQDIWVQKVVDLKQLTLFEVCPKLKGL